MSPRRIVLAAAALALLPGAASAAPIDPLAFLVGRWSCTTHAGTRETRSTSTFERALGGAWLREIDAAGDGRVTAEQYVGFDRARRQWVNVAVDAHGGYGVSRTTTGTATRAMRWTDAAATAGTAATDMVNVRGTTTYTITHVPLGAAKPSSTTSCTKAAAPA